MAGPDLELPGRLCQEHGRTLDDRLTLVQSGFKQARYWRIVDHIEDRIRGNWPLERRRLGCRLHSDRRAVDQQIAAITRRFCNFTSRKNRDLASVFQCRHCGLSRTAGPKDHGYLARGIELRVCQSSPHTVNVGVVANPFTISPADRIHGPGIARFGSNLTQKWYDCCLVRKGDGKTNKDEWKDIF